MTIATMLIVCDLENGCVAPDGTLQPSGTAFQRLVVETAMFSPGLGLKMVADDGRQIYVPNGSSNRPAAAVYPTYANDTDAQQHGLQKGDFYNSSAGVQQVGAAS